MTNLRRRVPIHRRLCRVERGLSLVEINYQEREDRAAPVPRREQITGLDKGILSIAYSRTIFHAFHHIPHLKMTNGSIQIQPSKWVKCMKSSNKTSMHTAPFWERLARHGCTRRSQIESFLVGRTDWNEDGVSGQDRIRYLLGFGFEILDIFVFIG